MGQITVTVRKQDDWSRWRRELASSGAITRAESPIPSNACLVSKDQLRGILERLEDLSEEVRGVLDEG